MEWVRGDVVGHGSFGTVNLAIPRKRSHEVPPFMAVKSCGSSHSGLLLNEKSTLEELNDCPQIIKCFGGGFSLENGERLCNLLLEFASGGSLADKLRNCRNHRLLESEVRRYSRSVLEGLRYIHGNGFVHCDLKLQNVLLCQKDVAKIADFGLAKRAGEKTGPELRGTPLYMSPEMVVSGEQEAPADVWALGCLVAEMATGAPAWPCQPDADLCGLLMRIGVGQEIPEIPGNLSAEGKDFLGKCFVKDPRKRWTAEMLLSHPFVVDSCEFSYSDSPRGPLDLPESEFGQSSSSITSLPLPEYFNPLSSSISPANRVQQLVTNQRPDWSVTDSWLTVR
ncbi:mitogen-activated protein kinase kinase kinase 20-like [Diospyros lotus]|uniref:mitogen-activated protein kinase kinase kinase 20-like n=1 Tax=Diospyros lotus TaxID=55363 RepID=UPI002250888B|nr:mitogen-activated protein kinase kinase kinase 20-like [Diospyros lotus]